MEDNLIKAKLGKRIGAFLIDHIIYTIILVLPFNLLTLQYNSTASFERFNSTFPILMIIAFIAYAFKDIFNGRSIGKRILGLYVRDYNDLKKIPEIYRLITRNLLISIWPIEYIVLTKDKDGRRLGDRIAKTQVVEIYKEIN